MRPNITKWFLTGQPGIGKTTVCLKIVELLRKEQVTCGGIVSREIRKGSIRVGFEFIDILSGESFPLSSTTGTGPTVGKYRVNLEGIRKAVKLVEHATAQVTFLDEIGPMELKSRDFALIVEQILQTNTPMVIVVHRSLASHYNCLQVTKDNRDILPANIFQEVLLTIGKIEQK